MEDQTNKQEGLRVATTLLIQGLIKPKTTEEFLKEADKVLKWMNA